MITAALPESIDRNSVPATGTRCVCVWGGGHSRKGVLAKWNTFNQGSSQTLTLGWAREENVLIFPHSSIIFFHLSSICPHFFLNFSSGGRLVYPRRPWLRHCFWSPILGALTERPHFLHMSHKNPVFEELSPKDPLFFFPQRLEFLNLFTKFARILEKNKTKQNKIFIILDERRNLYPNDPYFYGFEVGHWRTPYVLCDASSKDTYMLKAHLRVLPSPVSDTPSPLVKT